MTLPLSQEFQKLLIQIEDLDTRVVTKMEKIKFSEGWAERKKKALAIRLLLVQAKSDLQEGKTEDIPSVLKKLNDLGVRIEF